eukprot:Nitzschia sp. Nitz4//scaffold433_size7783//3146//4816//NITZ4_009149-RA/size7783-exonerate_protein2genome-gene-0.0-mRNA-1//-1//CDS//3329551824//6161//frame0
MLIGDEGAAVDLDPEEIQRWSPKAVASCLAVTDENNQNLTTAEKELLLLHCRYGHANLGWIQSLLSQPRDGSQPTLQCKHRAAATTSRKIFCTACNLGKAKSRSPTGTLQVAQHPDPIRADDLNPGDCVSIDIFQSATPGRTLGDRASNNRFAGGTIFCDHATSLIYVSSQASLKGGETTMSKRKFEQWAAEQNVPRIEAYRADNKPFANKTFQADVDSLGQSISFSGVGAKHQNGVAERSIQTISNWARTMLLHQVLHWPEQADLTLWPFALEHAVYIWNRLPRKGGKLSPLELFTRTKDPGYASLQSLHVWGCPTYVLDATLQDGKKLPKWSPRARRGIYLGLSNQHSSTVARVMHTGTKNVSSQFHFVCDDHFSTVTSEGLEEEQFSRRKWDSLIETGYEALWEDADVVGCLRQRKRFGRIDPGRLPKLGIRGSSSLYLEAQGPLTREPHRQFGPPQFSTPPRCQGHDNQDNLSPRCPFHNCKTHFGHQIQSNRLPRLHPRFPNLHMDCQRRSGSKMERKCLLSLKFPIGRRPQRELSLQFVNLVSLQTIREM